MSHGRYQYRNCQLLLLRVLNHEEADQLEVFNGLHPLCRLRFNKTQKLRLGVFNEKKEEMLMTLESVDDIFNYADQLNATLSLLTFDQESTAKE